MKTPVVTSRRSLHMTRDDRIRIRAYEIWQREGRPEGRHEQHWVAATGEIDEEDAAERRREAHRRQGDEGTTDQRPRWEGPPREPSWRLFASD